MSICVDTSWSDVPMPKWPLLHAIDESGGPSFLRAIQAAIAAHWVDKAEKEHSMVDAVQLPPGAGVAGGGDAHGDNVLSMPPPAIHA